MHQTTLMQARPVISSAVVMGSEQVEIRQTKGRWARERVSYLRVGSTCRVSIVDVCCGP